MKEYICTDCGEKYKNKKDWMNCPCKEQAEEELNEVQKRNMWRDYKEEVEK